MNLPILEMSVDDLQDVGINYMSLVKKPAIQVGWVSFAEHEIKFAIENEEERIVFGPVLIPNQKVYRKDEQFGEYYVTATDSSIRAIREKFFKSQRTTAVNTNHSGNDVSAYLMESFISNEAKGISTPEPFGNLPYGTWYVGYKIDDDNIWNDVKSGKFMGFSLEGKFNLELKETEIDNIISEIENLVNSKLNIVNK